MNKVVVYLVFFLSISLHSTAQYSTPGTGVHWTMDSLVLHSIGVVTQDMEAYSILQDLTISASDTLALTANTLVVSPDVLLTVDGHFSASTSQTLITSFDAATPYEGIRVNATGSLDLSEVLFLSGGGIKCLSDQASFNQCSFEKIGHLATNNAALEFSNGQFTLEECSFFNSQGSAISTPANGQCALILEECTFSGNNNENTNRPQINLGPVGTAGVTRLINCTILGAPSLTMVGGVAFANFFEGVNSEVRVEGCVIRDNRYGITMLGSSIYGLVDGCTIEDNTTQGDPFLGGSGVNFNGDETSSAILRNNFIRGNLWGITVQSQFFIDMGSDTATDISPGNNVFSENGNGGLTYALFNNTPQPINAYNNCWIEGQESTIEQMEEVISHSVDDSNLGTVDFSFPLCGLVDDIAEFDARSLLLYPSPASDFVTIEIPKGEVVSEAYLLDARGRKSPLYLTAQSGRSEADISNKKSGVYTLILIGEHGQYTSQLIVE